MPIVVIKLKLDLHIQGENCRSDISGPLATLLI